MTEKSEQPNQEIEIVEMKEISAPELQENLELDEDQGSGTESEENSDTESEESLRTQPEENSRTQANASCETVQAAPATVQEPDVEPIIEKYLDYPEAPERVFFFLHQGMRPRRWCLKLVLNPWFDRLTMLVIVLNCVFMAMYKPCEDDDCYTFRCYFLEYADYAIFAYFALEMIVKMVAFGIFGPKAYLSDPWNRLDCFIVMSGAVTFVIEAELGSEIDLTAFRTIRVLRPLRAVNRVASLKVIVTLMVDTLPMVINVLALFVLFFFIFGFIGIQLWGGALRNRCTVGDPFLKNFTQSQEIGLSSYYEDPIRDEYLCSPSNQHGLHSCEYNAPTTKGDLICGEDLISWDNGTIVYPTLNASVCINWNQYFDTCSDVSGNPYYGAISFDNIGKAFVTIFVVVSMEGWTDIMYYVQDVASFWSWIYFVIMIVLGSCFMLNLFLVVFSVQFSATRSKVQDNMMQKSQKGKLSNGSNWKRRVSTIAKPTQNKDDYEDISIYEAIIELAFSFPQIIHELMEHCPIRKCRIKPKQQPLPQIPEAAEDGRISRGVQTEKKELMQSTRSLVRTMVESNYFRWFIMAAILLNTITLAMEHHNQSDLLTTILDYFNIGFTIFFAVEMVVKLFGLGIHDYFIDPFNMFDAVVVIVSIIDVCQDGSSGLSVLRTFRLLRIVKLVRFMPGLRHQIGVMVGCLNEVAVVFVVMILFVLIFSLMGMNLFGRKLCFMENGDACNCTILASDDSLCDCSRMNFDSFVNASLTVFQILTTEDWNEVLFNSMNSVGDWSFLYFLLLITIGNYILLNLLVAILVDGVSKQEVAEREETRIQKFCQKLEAIMGAQTPNQPGRSVAPASAPAILLEQKQEAGAGEGGINLWAAALSSSPAKPTEAISSKASEIEFEDTKAFSVLMTQQELHLKYIVIYLMLDGTVGHNHDPELCTIIVHNETDKKNVRLDNDIRITETLSDHHTSTRSESVNEFVIKLKLWVCSLYQASYFYHVRDYSLWVFSPENPIRKLCCKLVFSKWFDNLVLFIIFLNCVFMAMERPTLNPDGIEADILTYAGYTFTVIFTIEMIIKIVAVGLVFGENTFLHSSWNCLDGVLVTTSLVYMVFSLLPSATAPSIIGVLRVMRVVRALRPLRVVNHAQGLKLTLESLIRSFKGIGNVLLICAVFYVIFGILGVQLFKGTMYYCDGTDVANVSNKDECLMSYKNEWVNAKFNYDNLGNALLTLFVMSTIDGWVGLMHQAVDAVDVDQEPIIQRTELQRSHRDRPITNYNEWVIVYFVVFLAIVSFLILNLFVCVLVENYQHTYDRIKAEKKLQNQADGKEKSTNKSAKEDYVTSAGRCRAKLLQFVNHKYCNYIVLLVVSANAVALSTIHFQMSSMHALVLVYCNYAFTGFYVLEATIKVAAFTPCGYIRNGWNVNHILLVAISLIGIAMNELLDMSNASSALLDLRTVITVVQAIFMFLKLVHNATGLKSLVDTVLRTLPQVGNLALLFFLLFFIFSALGVELFGLSDCDVDHPCDGLGEHAHFKNFGMAFLTLFRIATGDNWNGILKDAMRTDCDDSSICRQHCCVNSILASLYFVIFVWAAQFILLNIVAAMLLRGFEESSEQETDLESGQHSEQPHNSDNKQKDTRVTNGSTLIVESEVL